MGNAAAGGQGNTDTAAADAKAIADAAAKATADVAAKATADAAAQKMTDDNAAADAKTAADAAAALKAEQGKETPGTDGKTPKAPDKYSLTVPENGQTYVDDQVQAQIETMARKAGWTNEDAQAALNEHVTNMASLTESFLTVTKADKEYGGGKLEETQRLAKAAIDRIRPAGHPRRESFMKFLNRFGGSNHLDSVSFLADVGRLMAEDQPGAGRGAHGQPQTAESKLYDKTPAG